MNTVLHTEAALWQKIRCEDRVTWPRWDMVALIYLTLKDNRGKKLQVEEQDVR